jgi:hypothetical protein
MVDLYFDSQADATLTALERNDSMRVLAELLDEALDLLAREPDGARVRRRRFQIGLWGIPVSGSGEDWIILWEPHPHKDEAVIVHYIGPASFA